MDSLDGRRSLILMATFDQELVEQISYSPSPSIFFPTVVNTLITYGKLSDNRDPLETLLESSKSLVGSDKQAVCDAIIKRLRDERGV